MILKLHILAVRIEDRWPGKYIHWLCVLTDKFIEPELYVARGSKLAAFILYKRDQKLVYGGVLIGFGLALLILAIIG